MFDHLVSFTTTQKEHRSFIVSESFTEDISIGYYIELITVSYRCMLQEFSLHILSERSHTDVELVEDPLEVSSINVGTFVDEQEWRLYRTVVIKQNTVNKFFTGSMVASSHHPCLNTHCYASRRAEFHIWNILLVEVIEVRLIVQ